MTDSRFGGRRFAYQFRSGGELPIWRDQREWRHFDPGAPALGLPRQLALLYDANADAIDAALDAKQGGEPFR